MLNDNTEADTLKRCIHQHIAESISLYVRKLFAESVKN